MDELQPKPYFNETEQELYTKPNRMFQKKLLNGELEPLGGKLQSAYNFYQLPEGETEYKKSFSRFDTFPMHSCYSLNFHGLLDHIIYTEDSLTLMQLLELPDESQLSEGGGCPNLLFPSDHMRIEAQFLLKDSICGRKID